MTQKKMDIMTLKTGLDSTSTPQENGQETDISEGNCGRSCHRPLSRRLNMA